MTVIPRQGCGELCGDIDLKERIRSLSVFQINDVVFYGANLISERGSDPLSVFSQVDVVSVVMTDLEGRIRSTSVFPE